MNKTFLFPTPIISPLPAVIVTACDRQGNSNLMTASWTGIVCSSPAMCYVSIRPERYTYSMVKETMQFAINLTTPEMAQATDLVGVKSGRSENKWQLSGLHKADAHIISCPLVAESPLSIECAVREIIPLGSHDMFLAEIVSVAANSELIDNKTQKLKKQAFAPLVYSLGNYMDTDKVLGSFGYSVKDK